MPQPFVVQPRESPAPPPASSGRSAVLHPVADETTDRDRVRRDRESRVAAAAIVAGDPGGWRPTRGHRLEPTTDGGSSRAVGRTDGRPATTTAPAAVGRAIAGHPVLAPLAPYLDDPAVTDIFINGAAGLFVDRGAGAVTVPRWRAAESDVRDLAVALIGLGGRHIDDATPCVDVRLEGGVRVHAVLPPIAPEGAAVSIRVPALQHPDLDTLQDLGMFDTSMRARLDELVSARANILLTGAAGSGKTTLLAALLGEAPAGERIVTIEDVAELRIDHPHHVRLEARQANLEGAGAVGLARLVREALRMRPDRLVVGECRGEEVRELLSALNTGHDGGAGTLHANGLDDVPARLESLGALAGLDDRALARQVASAIGCVLHLERDADGVRRIAGIGRPVIVADRLAVEGESWG